MNEHYTDNRFAPTQYKHLIRRPNGGRYVNGATECNRLIKQIAELKARLKAVRECPRYHMGLNWDEYPCTDGSFVAAEDVLAAAGEQDE